MKPQKTDKKERNQQEKAMLAALVVLSVLTSFAFIFYSLGILSADEVPRWQGVFAYVTAGYGLGNILALSFAWNTRGQWTTWLHKLLAFCYLGVFILDQVRGGFGSVAEVGGILVLALLLRANWLAVSQVIQR